MSDVISASELGGAPAHYDAIVIGAGSIGTPAAMSLAEAGMRVLVLDERPSVGLGSNKSAVGGARATRSDPAKIRLNLRSNQILAAWKERCGDDIEWKRGGYMFPVYREQDEKTLNDLLAVERSLGLDIQWLDARSILEVAPDLYPVDLRGGAYSPDDGRCSPLLTLRAFYERAKRLGAEFHFDERVTGVKAVSGRVRGVTTDRTRYGADVVINAAGAWARSIAGLSGIDLPVLHDEHEAGITEPVAHFLDPLVVDIRPGPGSANCYFFQHKTGEVIFCVTPSPPRSSDGTRDDMRDDTRKNRAFLPTASRRLLALMPRLGALRVRQTWRRLHPRTPDGSPIVGWARELTGYLIAAGMCGHGFMLGPGLGELIARVALGSAGPDDADLLARMSPERPFEGQERLR